MFFLLSQSKICHWFYTCTINMNGAAPQLMVTDDYGNLSYCGKNTAASLS